MASKDFNYQVALKEGLKSLEQGRLRQAEQSFKYLVDKFPGAEGGYRGLAKVHFEEEDRAGALRVLRDGAAALTKSGERSTAIGPLRQAIVLEPRDRSTHRRRAAALALAPRPRQRHPRMIHGRRRHRRPIRAPPPRTSNGRDARSRSRTIHGPRSRHRRLRAGRREKSWPRSNPPKRPRPCRSRQSRRLSRSRQSRWRHTPKSPGCRSPSPVKPTASRPWRPTPSPSKPMRRSISGPAIREPRRKRSRPPATT